MSRTSIFYWGLVAFFVSSPCLAAYGQSKVIVLHALKHDVSRPLRDMRLPRAPVGPPRRIIREQEEQAHGVSSPKHAVDPVLQSEAGAPPDTIDVAKFDGVDCCNQNTGWLVEPPDVNGAVGTTQYVSFVNSAFGIYDKHTGALLYGIAPGYQLWSGFGNDCETTVLGDVVVQFDKRMRRWIMIELSATNGVNLLCMAISKNADATGSWYRYVFSYPDNALPDYPKLGVWPDGYYLSVNFGGSYVCALDRTAMLRGDDAQAQCFQMSWGVLPSDLDGLTLPPKGTPNYLVNIGSNSVNFWKFHVNWKNSAKTTLVGPISVAVSPFAAACDGADLSNCIPQKGTTQKLDAVTGRPMNRLAYRNFGDHQSLVLNHSVTAGDRAGERWYEIRLPNGTPQLYQSGTYAPGASIWRWMGSIAMDKKGDIALGYSAGGPDKYPSIRYTGRVPTDKLGKMEGERIVQNSVSYQTLNRWGDYTDMTVDPIDDCTFYYTNEYLPDDRGIWNWKTKVNAFRFAGCQ